MGNKLNANANAQQQQATFQFDPNMGGMFGQNGMDFNMNFGGNGQTQGAQVTQGGQNAQNGLAEFDLDFLNQLEGGAQNTTTQNVNNQGGAQTQGAGQQSIEQMIAEFDAGQFGQAATT